MGNSQSSPSGTQFVNTEQPAAASYHQCHVFGDSNLYGVGIRIGYYLLYTGALLSQVFLQGKGHKPWLLSFVLLAAASLVVLSLNAAGGGLVFLDWAIVLGLVFWSIVFLVWPVFCGRDQGGVLGFVGNPRPIQQALEREQGRFVGDREAEWHARYVNVLRVLGLEGEDGNGRRTRDSRHFGLEVALRDYVAAFTPARFSLVSTEATGYILDLYGDGRASQVATRMMIDNKQIESFRDSHVEAMRLSNIPFDQAQSTTMALGRYALEGLPSAEATPGPRSAWWAMMELGQRARTAGMLTSCGLGLVLFSGFATLTVWAVFRAVNIGARSGCNIRFVFLVVPASVYNRSAITALRVFVCIWFVLVGIPTFLIGVALLVLGIKDWGCGAPSSSHHKRSTSVSRFSSLPYDAEKGKAAEIASPASPMSAARASRTSEAYEMDELRTPTSPTARDTRGSSFFGSITKDPPPSSKELETRGGATTPMLSLPYLPLPSLKNHASYILLLPLLHTITLTEVTIRINNLDMAHRAMSSTGELFAFFLGAFFLIHILALCVREGIQSLQRRRSAGWFEERRRMLLGPANRVGDPDYYGGGLRKETSVGEGSVVGSREGIGKGKGRLYLQGGQERKSGSSMGKFREMIDDEG